MSSPVRSRGDARVDQQRVKKTRLSRRSWLQMGVAMAVSVHLSAGLALAQAGALGLGRAASSLEMASWGPIVGPDGDGLPDGGATASAGRTIYERRCLACHGATGQEGPDTALAGGHNSLATASPQKTVGSYWPVATTLWDYINRAMPFNRPGSLTSDEVYAVVAYVLYLNDLVDEQDRIDAETLPGIAMPNRDGFVSDPRPDLDRPSDP